MTGTSSAADVPIQWPHRWQQEARDKIEPYFGQEVRLRVIVGPPVSRDGTLMDGFVYLVEGVPTVIHDHSGRKDVYPWTMLAGPVLRIYELRPRRKPLVVFADPGWTPRRGE